MRLVGDREIDHSTRSVEYYMIMSINDGARLLATTRAGGGRGIIDVLGVKRLPLENRDSGGDGSSGDVSIMISDKRRYMYPLGDFMQRWYFADPQNDRNYSRGIPNVGGLIVVSASKICSSCLSRYTPLAVTQ